MNHVYRNMIKPAFDVLVALILIICLSPIFLVITILLYIVNEGKPFFLQERPGKHERTFSIIKFKTMTDKTDDHGVLLSDTERLTAIGALLRKTSLDELPQLINVIKGEMSFIGPRPLLIRYLPYYSKREKLRHTVKPGLTGLAQISGRNYLNWDERLNKDVEYVQNMSLKLDAYIFIKTLKKVLFREDVVVDPDLIMEDLETTRKNI